MTEKRVTTNRCVALCRRLRQAGKGETRGRESSTWRGRERGERVKKRRGRGAKLGWPVAGAACIDVPSCRLRFHRPKKSSPRSPPT